MPRLNIEPSNPPGGLHCPRKTRFVLLAIVALHFLGVLSEPLRFFSRSEIGTAPEFVWLGETMRPYSQWLYLNHGYFFFAPNPGPSHLIEGTVPSLDGKPTERSVALTLPDRKRHWPRLLYHRYFMLSEFYNSRFAPARITEELKKDPEFLARWTFDRDLYSQIQTSLVHSLQTSRGLQDLELRRVERELPDPARVLIDGWALNDPRFTIVLPESMIEPPPSAAEELLLQPTPTADASARNPAARDSTPRNGVKP